MMPSLFISHGSPMIAIEKNEYTQFLSDLGNQINPKAIVIFSAHWESDILTVSFTDEVYETIYDFGGFPEEMYTIKYPARGSTEIAAMLLNRFAKHGISARKETSRGLDHGSWVVLRHMYPEANIPVIQVSVNSFLPAKEQLKIGEALQGLENEDILIIGSGATVHNLRMLKWGETNPEPWAVEFDDWLIDKLQNRDVDSLLTYEESAPHSRMAVPSAEHFIPLFIALGSRGTNTKARVLYRHYDMGTLSYLCLQFN